MRLLDRVFQLMTFDLNHLLDQAEDPDALIQSLIGDMEASIVDLRREMVTAVTRQGRLRRELSAAEEAASRVEGEATLALARGEELRARQIVGREIGTLKTRDALAGELAEANQVAARLVAHLIQMEDRAQVARRKRDEIVRRRRAAETLQRCRPAPAPPGSGAFDGYVQAVTVLEIEAADRGERSAQEGASPTGAGGRFAKVGPEMQGGGGC